MIFRQFEQENHKFAWKAANKVLKIQGCQIEERQIDVFQNNETQSLNQKKAKREVYPG